MTQETVTDRRRSANVWISVALDDMKGVSSDAFRVYFHIVRRVGRHEKAWPSYRSIGAHCFPELKEDSARVKAIKAVKELIAWNLIEVEKNQTHTGFHSNNYYLTDESEWRQSPDNSEPLPSSPTLPPSSPTLPPSSPTLPPSSPTLPIRDLQYKDSSIKDSQRSVYKTRTREETHTPELNKKPEPEATELLTPTQIINIQPVQEIQSSEKDQCSAGRLAKKTTKYDPGLGMRPPTPRIKYLIPDGDWLTETGQLDPNFIRHIAKQWMDSPGAAFHKMPIEEVEAKVFGHFARNHDKLVIAWEGYSKVALRHAEGIKMRLDAEISIPESEQQQVINEGRAIASALSQPEEEKAVPSLPTQENRKPFGFVLPEATAPQPKAITPQSELPKPTEAPRDDDGLVENPNAYQPYSPEPISPEEQKANIDKMNEMIRNQLRIISPYVKQKNKRAISSFPSNLSEANEWCKDSCLRSQAVLWAKREGYAVEYSLEGVAIEIFEF